MTIISQTKSGAICGVFILLSACATTTIPKQPVSEQIAEVDTLITRVKKYNRADVTAGEELRRAEQNLKHAEEALKQGDDIEAQQSANKAQSDAEYAQAKIKVIVYKDQVKLKEELLIKFQEMHEQQQAPAK
jgi:multidrug resistance efflux pump